MTTLANAAGKDMFLYALRAKIAGGQGSDGAGILVDTVNLVAFVEKIKRGVASGAAPGIEDPHARRDAASQDPDRRDKCR